MDSDSTPEIIRSLFKNTLQMTYQSPYTNQHHDIPSDLPTPTHPPPKKNQAKKNRLPYHNSEMITIYSPKLVIIFARNPSLYPLLMYLRQEKKNSYSSPSETHPPSLPLLPLPSQAYMSVVDVGQLLYKSS